MALKEAARGLGVTSPNPRVGAVIVSGGQVIARGYHRAFGALHAEVDSLAKLPPGGAAGATLYVNLEPCCHLGKTPPCTRAIIEAGIARLVYGTIDPNPLVNGRGLRELKEAGVEVQGPVLEEEARELNRGYIKFQLTGRPWVTLKMAQSLDGRIAASSGDSRWISNPNSLKLAHRLRAEHDAVLVGINTVLVDDPQLTVRRVRGRNPRRVVLDSDLRLSPEAKVFVADSAPVLIATRPHPPAPKAKRLEKRGADFIWLPPRSGHNDWPDTNGDLDLGVLLGELGKRGLLYLLVEGGGGVFSSFILSGLYDEIIMITAPIIIGGNGIPSVASLGIRKVAQSIKLHIIKRKSCGQDLALWLRPDAP